MNGRNAWTASRSVAQAGYNKAMDISIVSKYKDVLEYTWSRPVPQIKSKLRYHNNKEKLILNVTIATKNNLFEMSGKVSLSEKNKAELCYTI